MKIEEFEKAKTIQNEIEFLKGKKQTIQTILDNKQEVRFGIFSGYTNISLNKEEIEYISNFLLKKYTEDINNLEKEFSHL